MQTLFSLGELSTWAESVLQRYEKLETTEIVRCVSVEALAKEIPVASNTYVVLIENQFGSQKWIKALREQGLKTVLVWFGKAFSREDYVNALQNRVYTILEDSPEKAFKENLDRAYAFAQAENETSHLLRTLKTTVLQAKEETPTVETIAELKTVIGKLDRSSQHREWTGSQSSQVGQNAALPLHQSATFSDALLTVSDLERTGILHILSRTAHQQGEVLFLQGKIVQAHTGVVRGLKALYRMFLWQDLQFRFQRQSPGEISADEMIASNVRDICIHGEKLQKEFNHIRVHLPPLNLCLELDTQALQLNSRLDEDLFSTLASIVEFGKLTQVLDYNELPDVNIYHSLIALRKLRLIRVVPDSVSKNR